jgi:hypothetical protein
MPRPDFSALFEELDYGQVNVNASAQLAELVQAVRETGEAGKLVITLTVGQEGTMCVIKSNIKTTVPRPNAAPSMFFYGKEPGEITRNDPRQMELRSVYDSPPTITSVTNVTNMTPISSLPPGDSRRAAVITDEEKE